MKRRRPRVYDLLKTLAPALFAAVINLDCTKGCTLRACGDVFGAVVASGPGGFPVGAHQIDVTTDGATLSCAFMFPLPTLANGAQQGPQCPFGLTVDIRLATNCTQTEPSRGAIVESCVPIAGDVIEMIDVSGTPAHVRVRQTTNGVVVLDESVTPVYASNQPNGPGCDPICHQAGADWTLTAVAVRDGGSE